MTTAYSTNLELALPVQGELIRHMGRYRQQRYYTVS